MEPSFIEEIEIEEEGFVIDSDQKAEWALGKIAAIDEEFNRYDEVCEKQKEFYKNKSDQAKEQRDKRRGYLVSLLAQYFENVDSKATKTQATYKLPSGKLVKKFESEVIKHDDKVLIEKLKGTEFVEPKPSLKWAEYKKTLQVNGDEVFDASGKSVEGVTIEIKPASFDVEIGDK